MKLFHAARSRALSLLLSLVAFCALAAVAGCATVKHDVGTVTNEVITQGIDCTKAEIANQIPNVLAGVNLILSNPTTLQATKDAEITALVKGGEELMACVLRQVIGDIRDAVVAGAEADRAVRQMHDAATGLVKSHGYTYVDGWEQLEQ